MRDCNSTARFSAKTENISAPLPSFWSTPGAILWHSRRMCWLSLHVGSILSLLMRLHTSRTVHEVGAWTRDLNQGLSDNAREGFSGPKETLPHRVGERLRFVTVSCDCFLPRLIFPFRSLQTPSHLTRHVYNSHMTRFRRGLGRFAPSG